MAKDLFSNLDLNLLRTFIVLHQERNMRKASERLFVSQPAISKALQRLRDHFNDELFVKTHHGLRATEYANQLAESISPILDDLSSTLNESNEFNPQELDGVIKIALSPFLLSAIANSLFQAIRAEAPNVQVQLLNWSKSTMTDIINDEVQLGLNYEIGHAPK
ncbi:MAG: LysR family transcriptional regulator, partial [Aliivibrio sp.]|nr:LysR family transcriptional regulator [Aliivibrio sp.]